MIPFSDSTPPSWGMWLPGIPVFRCSFYLSDACTDRSGTNPPAAGIPTRKEQIAIIVPAVWLTVIPVFMVFAGNVNFGIFFVLSLIGLLVIVELAGPKYVKPRFLWYIRYLVVRGSRYSVRLSWGR